MQIIKKGTFFDLMGKRKIMMIFSLTLIILSLGLLIIKGINYGIDFSGGTELQVKFMKQIEIGEIRNIIEKMNLGSTSVQSFGDAASNEFLIRVEQTSTVTDKKANELKKILQDKFGAEKLNKFVFVPENDKIEVKFSGLIEQTEFENIIKNAGINEAKVYKHQREDTTDFMVAPKGISAVIEAALKTDFGADNVKILRVEFVGPKVGKELRYDAIISVLVVLGLVLLYIAWRFDIYFAPGAVFALIHDVIITLGVFVLFGKEFNLPILAALLAIVGYSLNDTVVVFDRIRDNARELRTKLILDRVNMSVNQTLSRTILTSLTTLFVVCILLVYGGGIIHDFSLALFVGVLVGTYSSIFIASPIYIYLKEVSEP